MGPFQPRRLRESHTLGNYPVLPDPRWHSGASLADVAAEYRSQGTTRLCRAVWPSVHSYLCRTCDPATILPAPSCLLSRLRSSVFSFLPSPLSLFFPRPPSSCEPDRPRVVSL